MNNYTSVGQIKADYNFVSGLNLKEIQLYLLWPGGERMQYYAFRNGKVLFSGNDFRPGAMTYPDSVEALVSCLAFLCVKPGDTDREYFKDYTLDQLNWANSNDCETVGVLIGDYENTDEPEFHENAKKAIHGAIDPGSRIDLQND